MAELLKGNFDFDDDDDGDNAEENIALEAIDAVKQASLRALSRQGCEYRGSNYLIDGSSVKNSGIEAIIKQGGDSLKTKQDLLLAKAQLKAFKINIKH